MNGYTVVDFETTGFSPQRGDRVVEIGVAYVSPTGVLQGHWSTLVNPQRDVGASHVHHITAADVFEAPTFDLVAPYLVRALVGRVFVAHNASFDLRFLEHELARAGMPLAAGIPTVCTMKWSDHFLTSPKRTLADCCAVAGVDYTNAHAAEADTLATAELLACYLRACHHQPPWTAALDAASAFPWPTYDGPLPPTKPRHRQRDDVAPDAWLDQIAPPAAEPARVDQTPYLELLERALVDRHLSAHEKRALVDQAMVSGLHRDHLDAAHRTYLTALAATAWADGTLTEQERADIDRIAAVLGISPDVADQTVTTARGADPTITMPTLHLQPGDRIVFTGDLDLPREEWIARAAALGLTHGAVTKHTRVVVAGDPDSLSSKARKARDYGIPVITEPAFATLVAAMERSLCGQTSRTT